MAEILACRRWNETPFRVVEGHRYRFSATGEWKDWRTPSGATGYLDDRLKRFEPLRRLPEARWFSLVGAVNRDRLTLFDIGHLIAEQQPWTAPETGTLYCFANDVWFMYWNNRGTVELSMEEITD